MSARLLVLPALFALGCQGTGFCGDAGKETFAPQGSDVSRYALIWKAQPFIKETVAVQQSPSLATKYALVGLVAAGDDSMAFLIDRNDQSHVMLSKKLPDKTRNLELVGISPSGDLRKSSVRIRQGVEQATLPFDQGALSSSGIGQQPVDMNSATPSPVQPGIPPSGIVAPQGSANIPVPPPPGQIVAPNQPPTPTRKIIRPKPINVN